MLVGKPPHHIIEPAQGEEVVPLVVVERYLLAQPAKHRIRVGVEVHVVGVVIQLSQARSRHVSPLGSSDLGLRKDSMSIGESQAEEAGWIGADHGMQSSSSPRPCPRGIQKIP